MRTRDRRSSRAARATLTGTLRVAGPKGAALPDLVPGDVLAVDLADLDSATAEAIAQAGVGAVVNLGRLSEGRYTGLGPAVLADADLVWIDEVGREAADRLADGISVRLHRGEVHLVAPESTDPDATGPVAVGRELDLAALASAASREPAEPGGARGPLQRSDRGRARPRRGPRAGRLDNSRPDPTSPDPTTPDPTTPDPTTPDPTTPDPTTPDVPADGDTVLDAIQLQTAIEGRPVVVVVMATATHPELRALRRFLRNASPVFVVVGKTTVEDLVGLGRVPDVVVQRAADHGDVASEDVLSPATDVVVVSSPGADVAGLLPSGHRFQRVESAESVVAIALRLAQRHGASVVVGAGLAPAETRLGALPFLDVTAVGDLSAPRRGAPALVVALALLVGGALGVGAQTIEQGPRAPYVTPAGDSAALITSQRQAQADERSAQSLVRAVAPRVYGTGLAGHGVVVVGLPGASASQVAALSDQVRMAGGVASRSVTLLRSLIDPDNQSQVDTVGTGLLTQLADPRLDPAASTYVRMGQLLSLAITTAGPVSAVADPPAVTIREALQSAGLARFPTDMRLAPMVLLVLPPDPFSNSADTALLTDLINGLSTSATAVVVVGDAVTGRPEGTLADLRAQTLSVRVSTVDGVDQPTGMLSMVLALESALTGTTGAYGVSGADGPVPGGS